MRPLSSTIRGLVPPLVLAFVLALVASLSARAASRIDHEASCTYKTLSWSDFRGPEIRGQGQAWINATVVVEPVAVKVEQEGESFIARPRKPVVYALMNKLDSGAQRGARNDTTLAHEQLHFDITEVHARRLVRELGVIEVSGSGASPALRGQLLEAVAKIYDRTIQDLFRMQRQYDGETTHGTRRGKQKKWSARVAELLAGEQPYELR